MASAATTVAELIAGLDDHIDPGKAAGWDPAGLQIGDPRRTVRRVGVCHEVTEAVVTAVEADPVDLLVTYHPLLFTPTARLVAGRTPPGRALRLIAGGVAVAVVHTGFDAARGGTADALASALGVVDPVGFGPLAPAGTVKMVTFAPAGSVDGIAGAMAAAGAGVIGRYRGCSFRSPGTGAFDATGAASPVVGGPGAGNRVDEVRLEMVAPASREADVVAALVAAHPYEEPAFDVYDVRSNEGFVGRVGSIEPTTLGIVAGAVARALGGEGLRVSGDRDAVVARVAVVPGSGGSFVAEAASAGCDVIVTGDVGHHTVVEARDRGLGVIDPGHAPTERPGVARLVALVGEIAPEVVDLTGLDPTPWR